MKHQEITMTKWSLVWCDCTEVYELKDLNVSAVIEFILELHGKELIPRPVVEMFSDEIDKPSMSIALGRFESVVTLEPSINPPYYISLGDNQREGLTELFCHGNQAIEYYARNLVSSASALEILNEFLHSQNLSKTIEWERL